MSKIFAIRNDGIKFLELDLEILDVTRHKPDNVPLDDVLDFHIRNTKMKSWWKTPETDFLKNEADPEAPIPDISCWIDATLLLSPQAHRLLGDTLQSSGEFLPVIVNNETYYIFNCFVIGEANEDSSKHDFEGDMQLGLNYLEFKDSATENLIFKTPFDSCLTLFCTDRFKEIVESFDLKGVVFDKNLIEVFA